jgi:hypothetical protein
LKQTRGQPRFRFQRSPWLRKRILRNWAHEG